jgi:hypothetical protein
MVYLWQKSAVLIVDSTSIWLHELRLRKAGSIIKAAAEKRRIPNSTADKATIRVPYFFLASLLEKKRK